MLNKHTFYILFSIIDKKPHKHWVSLSRGKWGKVKQNFSSVSHGVHIANMVIVMY